MQVSFVQCVCVICSLQLFLLIFSRVLNWFNIVIFCPHFIVICYDTLLCDIWQETVTLKYHEGTKTDSVTLYNWKDSLSICVLVFCAICCICMYMLLYFLKKHGIIWHCYMWATRWLREAQRINPMYGHYQQSFGNTLVINSIELAAVSKTVTFLQSDK